MSGLRCLLFWLLLMTPAALLAAPTIQPASMKLGATPDAVADATARMVDAMLEYTRWPSARPVVRLCLMGAPRHAARLGNIELSSGARVDLVELGDPGQAPSDHCDVLYIGRLEAPPMRRLAAAMQDQPVATIAEDDPDCRSGAMFCLLHALQSLSFKLNIDAVSRSAVRIDPRVLRLSKGGY